MSLKKFKDPIYGYIEIDEEIVHNVIDTATFQRLRNIRQTSYAPLYPAALHNRFVHSLGVYHLGQIAFRALQRSAERHRKNNESNLNDLTDARWYSWDRYKVLFELACLLHDVGHSPFSHTGEEFYSTSLSSTPIILDDKKFERKIDATTTEEERKIAEETYEAAKKYTIRKHLSQLTGDSIFISPAGTNPAPHEIMSCIVALEAFGDQFQNNDEKSFFARCITGLQYEEVLHNGLEEYMNMQDETYQKVKERSLRNCFIQLLHSSVIDVDRLDYIIRDASTMGYQSVSVDYERLLEGIVIVKIGDYNFTVGFHKAAISVIENAVYAHDIEKKWVQGHPAILYDSFLLHRSIVTIEDHIKTDYPNADSTLFSYDSLTSRGSQFGEMKVRFLGDADLIHLMKNVYPSTFSEEYFNRNTRRLPVWKSEAEFRAFFSPDIRKKLNSNVKYLMSGQPPGGMEINDPLLKEIEEEICKSKNQANKIGVLKKKITYLSALLDLCDKYEIRRDLVLLSTSFFKSNFSKDEIQKLPIAIEGAPTCQLHEVSSTLSSSSTQDDKLFYLFYYPQEGRKKISRKDFTHDLEEISRQYQFG